MHATEMGIFQIMSSRRAHAFITNERLAFLGQHQALLCALGGDNLGENALSSRLSRYSALGLERPQPLIHGLQIVPQPHAAHAER